MAETDEREDWTYGAVELEQALDALERRALAHQRAPKLSVPMMRALQAYAGDAVRQASRTMAEAAHRRRVVTLAMTTRGFPAELYIEKIRADHAYRQAARALERSKRRSGMAFRALERSIQAQKAVVRMPEVAALVAATRRSLRHEERPARAAAIPEVGRTQAPPAVENRKAKRSVGW